MKGVILINAYADMKAAVYGAERLKEELEKRGADTEILKNDFFAVRVNGGLKTALADCDFCVFYDKDKYVLQGLEEAGVRLFNCYYGIEACDDKMTTCLTLAGKVRMPKTLPGIFCFTKDARVLDESLKTVEEELGYPLVVKECYGSCGAGVRLVKNRKELRVATEELLCVPHLYQEFVSSSCGRDVRVIVIGGKVLGAMLRQSISDFRSNVALGGSGEKYELSEKAQILCEKIAALLKLDYCGIDLLFDEKGEPSILCEVNSNAFFGGFERATGKNVAAAYAEHILKTVRGAKA